MIISLFIPLWLGLSFAVGIVGLSLLICDKILPPWLTVLYKYGKTLFTLDNRERHVYSTRFMRMLMIQKRFFSHFYFLAAVIHMIIIVSIFFSSAETRQYLSPILRIIFGDIKYDGVPKYFFFLLCISHITRRFMECVLINVKSVAKINVIHYLIGFLFYISIALFNANNLIEPATISQDRPWAYGIGLIMFFLGQALQFHTHVVLANYRRNPNAVQNYRFAPIRRAGYFLPTDCEFSLVSCPNYSAELVIYTGLFLLSGYNLNWGALYVWVLVNQIVAAKLTHEWYKQNFGSHYPSKRKAIIPFLI